jgi:hypothetical protein
MNRQYTREEEHFFNTMLSAPEYKDQYRIRRGEDGIWGIVCRDGDIEPYSLTELSCYVERPVTVARLIAKLPEYCTVTQGGQTDVVFKFPIEKLDEIAEIVCAYKRRHLAPEQRAASIERLQSFRFKTPAPQEPKSQTVNGIGTGGHPEYTRDEIGHCSPAESM